MLPNCKLDKLNNKIYFLGNLCDVLSDSDGTTVIWNHHTVYRKFIDPLIIQSDNGKTFSCYTHETRAANITKHKWHYIDDNNVSIIHAPNMIHSHHCGVLGLVCLNDVYDNVEELNKIIQSIKEKDCGLVFSISNQNECNISFTFKEEEMKEMLPCQHCNGRGWFLDYFIDDDYDEVYGRCECDFCNENHQTMQKYKVYNHHVLLDNKVIFKVITK